MKILLIGDSFGITRNGDDGENVVQESQTWPYLVKNNFSSLDITSDFIGFRQLQESIEILNNIDKEYNIIIVQAGLVDCFPRVLPEGMFRSKNPFIKLIRKAISKKKTIREKWLKYIYNKPMVPCTILNKKISKLLNNNKTTQFFFAELTDQFHEDALRSFGHKENIVEFNNMLNHISNNEENMQVLPTNKHDEPNFFSPMDSHFNVKGNLNMAKIVSNYISKEMSI